MLSLLLHTVFAVNLGGAELTNLHTAQPAKTVIQETYQPEDMVPIVNVNDLVKPSIVWATTTQEGKLYSDMACKKPIGRITKGVRVEVIRDHLERWYKINYQGQVGWVTARYLVIPDDPPTNPQRMTQEQIEEFVNEKGFTSPTGYFIWTDIDRQLTHVFMGKKGQWKLVKTIEVATGKNITPTIRGTFYVQGRGNGFPVDAHTRVILDTQFYGPYKFHSVVLNNQGEVVDATVGKRASHGCIRMAIEDARWIHTYIPNKTAVWIY